jgi:hypothetical protein
MAEAIQNSGGALGPLGPLFHFGTNATETSR